MNQEPHWFVEASQQVERYFSWLLPDNTRTKKKIAKYFPSEYVDILNFSGMEITPRQILLFANVVALFSFLGMFLFDIVVMLHYGSSLFTQDPLTALLMIVLSVLLPVVLMNLVASYPKTYAKYMKIHSLGDIPEVLSYLVMYLKLVPNLENSVKFAAAESSTSLACDLKKMLWDMEIRLYHGIEDALTSFASMWGKWSEPFKRSLHLIRSSVQERDEASRTVTLNRALDVALDGTKEMMNDFATKLHQPTMVIYSIGIMIPLSLVAMLPAAGLIGMRITIFQVFMLYDVILPLFLLLYMRKILLSRPATFNPPNIPDDHPDILYIHKYRRLIMSLILGSAVAFPGAVFVIMPYLVPLEEAQGVLQYIVDPNGLNGLFPVTLFLLWGVAVAVTTYCFSVYYPHKKVRDGIKQIEREFSDALYILGKRIAEDKSPEEAFMYAAHTVEGAKIAEVFSQTGFTLTAMHTNLDDALFSEEYGSLRLVYSDRIKAIMRLFVEGIKKSQRAVSVSLIKIADHLKELQGVETKIKDTLYSLTSTLRSTAAMFAPLIAGVTLAITKLITTILESMRGKISSDILPSGSGVLSSVADAFTLENVRPEYFVLVVGIYIIELVFLLTRFTNGIDEGDDKPAFMYSLGKTLPTSMIVLTLTIILGQMLFSQIIRTS